MVLVPGWNRMAPQVLLIRMVQEPVPLRNQVRARELQMAPGLEQHQTALQPERSRMGQVLVPLQTEPEQVPPRSWEVAQAQPRKELEQAHQKVQAQGPTRTGLVPG